MYNKLSNLFYRLSEAASRLSDDSSDEFTNETPEEKGTIIIYSVFLIIEA